MDAPDSGRAVKGQIAADQRFQGNGRRRQGGMGVPQLAAGIQRFAEDGRFDQKAAVRLGIPVMGPGHFGEALMKRVSCQARANIAC